MAKRQNFIELNGKRYDAFTGALLGNGAESQPANKATPAKRSVDGFTSRPGHITPMATAVQAPKPAPAKPVMDISRPTPSHLKHHAPAKSQTLMRHVVHKPTQSLKRTTKADSHTHALVPQPTIAVVPKLSHPKVDPDRARRAGKVPRSEYVRRYAPGAAALPPRPAQKVVAQQAAIKPVHASTPAAHTVAAPHPAASSLDVFERALREANSHLQPLVTPQKRAHKQKNGMFSKRAISIGAVSLSIALIAGFVGIQNEANFTMKYASHKAGISAHLPSYKPSGYAVGNFSYSAGTVGVQFANNASGQKFDLTQTASGWDSTALKENFVSAVDPGYKKIESAGRTIYTYGDHNATWVNGGIWYQVNSNGSLTTEELVNLASSM